MLKSLYVRGRLRLKDELDIIRLISEDIWMMNILKTAQTLELPDWFVCAGFIRTKIWDELHGFDKPSALADVDVVYFDRNNLDETAEKQLENKLLKRMPGVPWSVKNEARMHLKNGVEPYESTEDAIAKFPETATALGVKLDENDTLILTAPHGIGDVLDMIVRPTPFFAESSLLMETFKKRLEKKNWQARWKNIVVLA